MATPPACVNQPPTMRSPLGMVAKAVAVPLRPAPSGDQVVPFHRAIRLAAMPPAEVNEPAATRSPLGSAASALVASFMPVPNDAQVLVAGSQAAMLFAITLPATRNRPATTSRAVSGPAPSGSHIVEAAAEPNTPGTPALGNGTFVHCAAVGTARAAVKSAAVAGNGRGMVAPW